MISAALGPSGLHAQFLSWNIDAATLRAAGGTGSPAAGSPPLGASGRRVSDGDGNGDGGDVLSPQAMLEAVTMLLHSTSNLHEELHHSLMGYTFLGGSEHFVGVPRAFISDY